jgi:hypothetical protein
MTPNDIEILIHFHVSPTVHPRFDAGAVRDSIFMFVENGILELINSEGNSHVYKTTKKGKALMSILCNTPFPQQAWVDSNGNVIQTLT